MDNIYQGLYLISKILHRTLMYNLVIVSGNHISIGNILLSVILFLLGIKYYKNYTNFVGIYLRSKILDKDAVNALEKLIFYISIALYIITILQIANVPLNIFAFIGGALAIGIGLGAQTLINNFISSLIIMIERPIKIGDVVGIDGVVGEITSVGARCVVITTDSNVEILIPNSKLMQNSLVNWTFTDELVKHKVRVQVPRYSSADLDHRDFMSRLKKMLEDLESKFDNFKAGQVYLTKIDNDYLNFIINFSSNMRQPQEIFKNELNLSLLANFGENIYSVEYVKISEPKAAVEEAPK
jgi:small-conductance mechanosensitive channel